MYKLVLFDVDGVLTDGSLYYGVEGEVLKVFNVKDGFSVSLLHSQGIKVGLLSAKESEPLKKRAIDLKFDIVLLGAKDKLKALDEIISETEISCSEIVFVGDDINDLPVFEKIGLSIAPSDAYSLVKEAAMWVTSAKGGHGVAREVADKILLDMGVDIQKVYLDLVSAEKKSKSLEQ